jgi:hypothetical protein
MVAPISQFQYRRLRNGIIRFFICSIHSFIQSLLKKHFFTPFQHRNIFVYIAPFYIRKPYLSTLSLKKQTYVSTKHKSLSPNLQSNTPQRDEALMVTKIQYFIQSIKSWGFFGNKKVLCLAQIKYISWHDRESKPLILNTFQLLNRILTYNVKKSATEVVKIPSRGKFIYITREINFPHEGNSSTSRGNFK